VYFHLEIWSETTGKLRVAFELSVPNAGDHRFGVLQPLRVHNTSASMGFMEGYFRESDTRVTSTGQYFTRICFTSSSRGYVRIWVDLVVADPIYIEEMGRRVTKLTFWGGILPQEINELASGMTFLPVLRGNVILSVRYSVAWSLSFDETYPSPDKPFEIEDYRGARWLLDFGQVLPDYGMTVSITWSVPWEQERKTWISFWGGMLLAIGASGLFDSLRMYVTNRASGSNKTTRQERSSESEADRRRGVAVEKLWGSIIEDLGRMRKRPVARSIMARLYSLHGQILEFRGTVKVMGTTVDPLKTTAPSFTTDQANLLVRTYNSIIADIRSHLGKRDSYVKGFGPINELREPLINDVARTLFTMATNVTQIMSYMLRWAD